MPQLNLYIFCSQFFSILTFLSIFFLFYFCYQFIEIIIIGFRIFRNITYVYFFFLFICTNYISYENPIYEILKYVYLGIFLCLIFFNRVIISLFLRLALLASSFCSILYFFFTTSLIWYNALCNSDELLDLADIVMVETNVLTVKLKCQYLLHFVRCHTFYLYTIVIITTIYFYTNLSHQLLIDNNKKIYTFINFFFLVHLLVYSLILVHVIFLCLFSLLVALIFVSMYLPAIHLIALYIYLGSNVLGNYIKTSRIENAIIYTKNKLLLVLY